MIFYLNGIITNIEHDFIIIDVSGVGYQVYTSEPNAFVAYQHQEMKVYIHDHLREDAHLLYGFITQEEQHVFKQLIEVSGIGPKVALSALTGSSPQLIVQAIVSEDLVYLTKLSGIGKKTAQRIVIELKDKLNTYSVKTMKLDSTKSFQTTEQLPHHKIWIDAKQALSEWGYTEYELQQVWQQLKDQPTEALSVEAYIKLALKILNKT